MQNTQIDPQNHEQQLAYELVANTNSSFFLTGRAGTGKTTFLHNVQKLVGKQFVVLAPTGVAAILAGGETIHSFFGLPMEVCTPGTCGKMNETKILSLVHADTIIIDEVSMVRCDVMDAIDYTMRKTLRNTMPFGGKQMIFVGDMFQLPPVVTHGAEADLLKDLYKAQDFFFYKSDAIRRMRLVKIELRKVYRQEDADFLQILENVRMNKVTLDDVQCLNEHVRKPSEQDGTVVTLASINKTVDRTNVQRLEEIDAEEFVYEGHVEGKFEEKRFPVEMKLRLKVGAQVMFMRNDVQKRWVNGTLGKVSKLSKDEISVTLNNGQTYVVPCCSWESYSYEYDRKERKMKKERVGIYTQYPLRLAWAITIHKSQGMTFDKMYLDLSHGMFVPGQLYVALSRVRSLDGLFLSKDVISQYAHTSREVLNYASEYNNEQQINNEIESGKAVFDAIQRNDYDEAARQYLLLVGKRVETGDVKEAMLQAKHFLDTLICDEHLYGVIKNVPVSFIQSEHWATQFLAGLLSLYAGEYAQALGCMEKVLECHQCPEALYVKSRALAKMGRYQEADDVNCQLANVFEMSTPDAKVLYMIAIINELYIGEPGLDLMRKLVEARPKYDKGVTALRMLMKKHSLELDKSAVSNNELVELFNSDVSETEFSDALRNDREQNPQAVSYLIRRIKNQHFPEEE